MKLTADSYLAVLKKSGLIEADRLKKILDELRAEGINLEDSYSLSDALVDRKHLTRWQADKLLGGKSRGFFLGKYRLEALLGKGGMSSVYLAEHVLMRRRCAIKVLPQKRVNDSSYLGRFHREAQAVASLDHSNIVRAYDVDVDRTIEKDHEIHFLVMEYVEGRSLQEIVVIDGVLDYVAAADYIRQAAEGLAHAHDAGMVHRDVKPGNLLVDPAGVVKILDLGLARFFDDKDEVSLTVAHDEKVLGTADYLAPEQALDSHTVDARADIYGLGCTFYFMLTGHPPFAEGTLAQRLMSHQSKEPPAIEKERSDAPAGLVAIVRKMMAKKPDDRYQSAAEAAAALEGWLNENASDEWKAQHPGLTGSGVGTEASAADTAKSSNGEDTAVRGDNNLASFLSNLQTESDVEPATGSGKRRGKSESSKKLKPRKSRDSDVAKPKKTRDTGKVPVATPVAKPTETNPPVAQPVAVAAPVAQPVQPAKATNDQPRAGGGFFSDPKRVRLVAIIAAAVVAVTGIVWGITAFVGNSGEDTDPNDKKDVAKNNGGDDQPEIEAITVGPDADFATIAEAYAEAKKRYGDGSDPDKARQIIRVAGGKTYAERIVIDKSDAALTNLSLEIICEDDKPAVLAPTGNKPVVELIRATNVQLKGLEINAGNADVGIRVFGGCFDTGLSHLTVRGFRKTGLLADGLNNFGTPVKFSQIDFRTGAPAAVGIRFTGDAPAIEIVKCRFIGKFNAGVLYRDGVINNSAVAGCIFHEVKDGIRFEQSPSLQQTEIRDNTFHTVTNGIAFANPPNAQASSNFRITRNLFARLKGAALFAAKPAVTKSLAGLLPPNATIDNKTDGNGKKSPATFFRRGKTNVTLGFQSTNAGDAAFLKPKSGAGHADVGAR